MKLSDFDFDLPEVFIAQNPVEPRDSAKLMLLDRAENSISHNIFSDLTDLLVPGDVLVLNNSKVIPARLKFGSNKEIFLLSSGVDSVFECMVKPGRAFKEGLKIPISDDFFAHVLGVKGDGTRLIEFVDSDGSIIEMNEVFSYGETPLPPYIKRSVASDVDYQTVYAKNAGSVAAPTAGLHFTDSLLNSLRDLGVQICEVELSVSRGTFLPVKTKNIVEHVMHSESFNLLPEAAELLNRAKSESKRIVAVGTTSVRVLESCFIDGQFVPQESTTDIFIYPGYKWKAVDALITNFHLPKSTLLMLVSSFAGREFALQAYEAAKRNRYRFYSFGDAMLIV